MTLNERDFGRIEGRFEEVMKRLDKIEDKVDRVDTAMSEARGGWKTIVAVSGIMGVLGGLVIKILPFLPFR